MILEMNAFARKEVEYAIHYFNENYNKTIIIDDELSSVGSTNFDFRSFEHNFECSLFIYSHKTNAQMREIFNDDLKHCTTLNINTWRKRPILQKALESITRLLSPIL